LADTIPKDCVVHKRDKYINVPIQEVKEKEVIVVKRNEIVPLDGVIKSPAMSVFNLANLTGEAEAVSLEVGTFVKSGSINVGETVELSVVGDFSSSTYHKIVTLVEDAKANPARTVRLSEQANVYFTLVTLAIAGTVWFVTGDIARLLAVLVVATPCPLIIAAPVAFVSGMSRVAKSGIIVRKPAAFEAVASADVMCFDKTGTLTLGQPALSQIECLGDETEEKVLSIAAAIEIHSLHPLARAIIAVAADRHIRYPIATSIAEKIGQGIRGTVDGNEYTIARAKRATDGIVLSVSQAKREVARLHFHDELKTGTQELLQSLRSRGVQSMVITGDQQKNAERVFHDLPVKIYANQSPEEKFAIISGIKKQGHTVVMVGDGLNDAPALAQAHVGIVFSGTENGASIEASDIAVLGHDIDKLSELFLAAARTVKIARQSIYGGIIFSVVAMLVAALGYLHPVAGALTQEMIDIVVILNALRALHD
jgi:heavy metal translocating P-type ATPase